MHLMPALEHLDAIALRQDVYEDCHRRLMTDFIDGMRQPFAKVDTPAFGHRHPEQTLVEVVADLFADRDYGDGFLGELLSIVNEAQEVQGPLGWRAKAIVARMAEKHADLNATEAAEGSEA